MSQNLHLGDARPSLRRGIPTRPARLGGLIAVVLAALAVYVALSIVLAPKDMIHYNFKSERGSITLLSSAMFLAAGVLAVAALREMWSDSRRARLLWATFSAVMLYFSVDEVLQFHEKMGDFLDAHFSTGPFRTYNDVVVIVYGIIALPIALLVWREVLRCPRLFTMLIVTGVLYAATTSVDTLVADATPVSMIIEEGIKVHCSTFFMLSMLTGFTAARALRRGGSSVPRVIRSRVADKRARPRPASSPRLLGGVLLIMLTTGGSVALVGKGEYRILLTWLVTIAAGALLCTGAIDLDPTPRG